MREGSTATEIALHDRLHSFSHGLKNRMAVLWEALRHIHACNEDPTSNELMAHAEQAYFGAQRELEQLMDDLNVDRTIRPAPFAEVRASELLQQAIGRNEHRFSRKAQTIDVQRTEANVWTDAHWCVAILDALLSNASKFSPHGSRITITTASSNGKLAFKVSDAGVGLSKEDLDRLFVRYSLLSSRSTAGEQQLRGTLGRCRQWARALNGELEAESAGHGKGTCFTLLLPQTP